MNLRFREGSVVNGRLIDQSVENGVDQIRSDHERGISRKDAICPGRLVRQHAIQIHLQPRPVIGRRKMGPLIEWYGVGTVNNAVINACGGGQAILGNEEVNLARDVDRRRVAELVSVPKPFGDDSKRVALRAGRRVNPRLDGHRVREAQRGRIGHHN